MERLTSNKKVSGMGMFELAHNSCYIKDGKAWYRDYDKDIDARSLARRLLKDFAGGDDAFTCDEDFDEYMVTCLEDGVDSTEGLIALFYRNLWAMADLHAHLKHLEDLQEQGMLLELPCAVDSEIWHVDTYYGIYAPRIVRGVVDGYLWFRTCGFALNVVWDKPIKGHFAYNRKEMPFSEVGKTVFLTREEAEEALKRKEDRNEV